MADVSSVLSLRAIAIARKPASVSLRVIPRPIPRLPPVTTTLRMEADELPGICDRQGGNEIDGGGDLMRWQNLAAMAQDIDAKGAAGGLRRILQNHFGDDQRTGDGI